MAWAGGSDLYLRLQSRYLSRWGHGVAWVNEKTRNLYRPLTGNPYAENLLIRNGRRNDKAPWFSLVGVIANGHGYDSNNLRRNAHEEFVVPGATGQTSPNFYSPKDSGYLFCYANDAWGYYWNNRGSVRMTVARSKGVSPAK